MKRFIFAAVLAVIALPAFAGNVGVSINIGQPGYYGSIDIDNYPPPQLVYEEPIIVERVPVQVVREPLYLRVPPGYARHWRSHCREYEACGRPVYFVQDRWYNDVYVTHYRHEHGDEDSGDDGDRHEHHGGGHHHDDEDHGHGHGHGRDHEGD